VRSEADVYLGAVFQFSDPDEEDFATWFVQRVHSARLTVNVSCGSMSLGLVTHRDYIFGEHNGSIAGKEGLTFDTGDGYMDEVLDITSTLAHLNNQMHFMYFHSHGCAGQMVILEAHLDDLGNFGEGDARTARASVTFAVARGSLDERG